MGIWDSGFDDWIWHLHSKGTKDMSPKLTELYEQLKDCRRRLALSSTPHEYHRLKCLECAILDEINVEKDGEISES